jgi:hypothetical protein
MRRFLTGHFAVLVALLCLQATASMLALRRDPGDRLRAAGVSGLVWASLGRVERLQNERSVARAGSR